ncbi:dihydrolipoyllysine-residue acetyltransferase component of pyruvate dehydrogenase complex [Candidatus Phytoplasma oryzae]|uniref:Branched-chain alpha-keto acid dehydrogenase subunit E2 n=1 Tax=Candidatus Phytoplasma oryzae TaxID=203274 RepID=A0A139JR93_9MOLU|nr:dihydrolipoamide acetyltransferase family protein [Candidatus Phytoplasma oryzae]KXT29370.1 dihydrolipoyllysine-residue acetyltransferase component of pyruvate dehydrogenase complex [Candidatus Phytoplasma oryzae]RAM57955.1 branched-chain alpha-keto acid dehydrogenase subunit E2 [Candidatus Phytoplasma oryzae]
MIKEEKKRIEKISRLRETIAKKMIISKNLIPDATLMMEVDVTNLVILRQKYKEIAKKKDIKLTYMAFIAKVVSVALKEFDILNATFNDEKNELIYQDIINLGIAIDTPYGLIVPNIKNIENLTIFQLAKEIQTIAQTTLERKLKMEQITDGTFTLSNYGSTGVLYATPIIKHPELGILGIGSIVKKPVFKNKEIVISDILPLALTFDHRIIDGAYGGRFLNKISILLNDISELEKCIE